MSTLVYKTDKVFHCVGFIPQLEKSKKHKHLSEYFPLGKHKKHWGTLTESMEQEGQFCEIFKLRFKEQAKEGGM